MWGFYRGASNPSLHGVALRFQCTHTFRQANALVWEVLGMWGFCRSASEPGLHGVVLRFQCAHTFRQANALVWEVLGMWGCYSGASEPRLHGVALRFQCAHTLRQANALVWEVFGMWGPRQRSTRGPQRYTVMVLSSGSSLMISTCPRSSREEFHVPAFSVPPLNEDRTEGSEGPGTDQAPAYPE